MRTQGILYSGKGTVYVCELERCPTCNKPMQTAYTSKSKIVQSMNEVKVIAQRTKICVSPDCGALPVIWGSAEWGQIAPVYCTYGYDVIAQIGWLRQTMRQSFAAIHADLRQRLRISESEVRGLYHYRYLPLLACHERQQLERLKVVSNQVGLVLSLDGLAPEGGEPQLWLVREVLSGVILRCGWMSQQDQSAFVHFLQPIADLGLRVIAIISDKQCGLLPAIAQVFPEAKHAFCQTHYLSNIAAPIAEADEVMKMGLRQDVRAIIGEQIRKDEVEAVGVLTVTGVVPSPVEVQPTTAQPTLPEEHEQVREAVTRDICRRIRYLLTLKGRPPFRLAGIEMFVRLSEVKECLERLISHHPTPALLALQIGLQTSLQTSLASYTTLRQSADWLEYIANLLDPDRNPIRSGDQVRQDLFDYLDAIQPTSHDVPFLSAAFRSIQKITRSYAPGLFHSYDITGLPRTNNERESDFRDLNRRLLRTTGQKGLLKRLIQRQGAWELLSHPDTLNETIQVVSHIARPDFQTERLRVRQHRNRFRLHSRSAKQSRSQLNRLEKSWTDIPSDGG
jgi:hypothetical protein